jgi:hypothetical protein
MTSSEVLAQVEADIGGQWDRPTSHQLDLRACVLRPPREVTLRFDGPGRIGVSETWLVLVERPGDDDSYWVFYDPKTRAYGLAGRGGDGQFHHIGTYGSLWSTLEGM